MILFYLANLRLPTEKAHGLQIMKTCESLAQLDNLTVKLFLPSRKNSQVLSPFDYYGIKNNFEIIFLPSFNLLRLGKLGFLIQSFMLSFFALFYIVKNRPTVIFSRDWQVLYLLSFFTKKIIWEAHTNQKSLLIKRVINRAKKVITITHQLKQFYCDKFLINQTKIVVISDAVDLDKFNLKIDKNTCRQKLGLPLDKKIVLYAGHLYPWKGVDTLAQASNFLTEDILTIFVGGANLDLENFKTKYGHYENILILGQQAHRDIPIYLRSADLLVLPNTAKDEISRLYTSPMKLFEYLASATPIIASDLPSLREVLTDNNAYLVPADDPLKLASGIKLLLADHQKADMLSKQASLDVLNYTWNKRAEAIASNF
ncbi:MAG: hypothetical protein COX02_01770 [Candidatus Vogelbacteria bacterium CG22_combo_CG10-13_8_21_14_all_37_9]|uniref:Glycosyl transferase family 1 domain-containing protein n=1 Tax=Candidatus Vogelbacteria bacterium CG22_combo_CG10-13_8_21_14_all_37_9 TaxID=1975046 RepID=A0A2H0BKF9_9BACT|nr:MAG: hypothetical protein COX02_01770 [Candidatus Vogelbacteria bacterium CG22_combo_CG10-13_8_21_14_all_37_9]